MEKLNELTPQDIVKKFSYPDGIDHFRLERQSEELIFDFKIHFNEDGQADIFTVIETNNEYDFSRVGFYFKVVEDVLDEYWDCSDVNRIILISQYGQTEHGSPTMTFTFTFEDITG